MCLFFFFFQPNFIDICVFICAFAGFCVCRSFLVLQWGCVWVCRLKGERLTSMPELSAESGPFTRSKCFKGTGHTDNGEPERKGRRPKAFCFTGGRGRSLWRPVTPLSARQRIGRNISGWQLKLVISSATESPAGLETLCVRRGCQTVKEWVMEVGYFLWFDFLKLAQAINCIQFWLASQF